MHNAKKAATPSCGAAAVAWFMEKKEISVKKKVYDKHKNDRI